MERGVTYEDLVKNILTAEHSSWDRYFQDYDRRSAEVYGQIRAIISRYEQEPDIPAIALPVVPEPVEAAPLFREISEVADTKSEAISRHREFMCHV